MKADHLIARIERDLSELKKLVASDPEARITGCRLVRGSHGTSYSCDPLGTDAPPADWPHPRPTPREIAAARKR